MLEDQTISVVIPAYNEVAVIGNILERVQALGVVDEIVVVDDGSSDGTAEKVTECAGVRLLAHPYNIGNGAACR